MIGHYARHRHFRRHFAVPLHAFLCHATAAFSLATSRRFCRKSPAARATVAANANASSLADATYDARDFNAHAP